MDEGAQSSGQQRDAIAKDAAHWFASWQAGTIDEQAFERWRASDPAHALAYARVLATWEALGKAEDTDAVAPVLTRRRVVRGAAAGAALAAAGTGLLASRAYAWESASTGVGETRKLRLPDGSMAALNTDTRFHWRFSADRRELWLERGEVALELRPGAAARLATDRASAALTGGRFNARLQRDALDLIVLRGGAFSESGGGEPVRPARANAYQRLLFSGAAPAVEPVSGPAVEAALTWQSGDIVFDDTPLSQAAAEYNRYLLRKIVIEDKAVGEIRVGGRFVSSDPTDFLQAISTSLGVRVRSTDSGHHLSE